MKFTVTRSNKLDIKETAKIYSRYYLYLAGIKANEMLDKLDDIIVNQR